MEIKSMLITIVTEQHTATMVRMMIFTIIIGIFTKSSSYKRIFTNYVGIMNEKICNTKKNLINLVTSVIDGLHLF